MKLKKLADVVRRGRQGPSRRLYAAAVKAARADRWYVEYRVPDTVDGRFDMLALHLFLLQNRLGGAPDGAAVMREVLEQFVADMEQNLRELGISDPSMRREVRGMVEALYGRFEAYARAMADSPPGALGEALARNVWRDDAGAGPKMESLAAHVRAAAGRLDQVPTAALLTGAIPAPAAPDWTGAES